jgi:cytochrome bd-type quinol oxidase subunit 1
MLLRFLLFLKEDFMEMLGLYPLFYVPEFGSAWLMGLTGSIHIMASHTSVGAALLFAFLAHKAYKEDRPELYDYMKKYGMFLLIFSYVIGSITGPGIWYTATAASPRGISALIHNFVWVWATEWVFFVYEVLGVFALIYFMDKIDRKTHLKLTYTFAIASVGTLALIIGIISFMMWPGTSAYYATGSASDAFFGINTFPHMFLRIGFMIMMSGIIGLIISSAIRKENKALSTELTKKMGWVSFLGGM